MNRRSFSSQCWRIKWSRSKLNEKTMRYICLKMADKKWTFTHTQKRWKKDEWKNVSSIKIMKRLMSLHFHSSLLFLSKYAAILNFRANRQSARPACNSSSRFAWWLQQNKKEIDKLKNGKQKHQRVMSENLTNAL